MWVLLWIAIAFWVFLVVGGLAITVMGLAIGQRRLGWLLIGGWTVILIAAVSMLNDVLLARIAFCGYAIITGATYYFLIAQAND